MIRTLLLSTCLCLAQDAPPKPASDPLEELVKKTNALEGFTAEYRMTDRVGNVSQWTLYYEASDRAALTAKFPEGVFRAWCINGESFIDSAVDDRNFARVNLRELMEPFERVLEIKLRAEFPGAPKSKAYQFGPGAYLEWDWIAGKNGEKGSIDLRVGWEGNRTHVCGWLRNLQARSLKPRETEDELVFTLDESVEVQISKSTGFVTRAHSTDPESKGAMVLESLVLEPPDDGVFSAPQSAPEGAEDDSAHVFTGMRSYWFNLAREAVWSRLAKWINDGHVTWDEDSPEKLVRVFRDLHAESFGDSITDYLKQRHEWINSMADDLAERVRAIGPDDDGALASLLGARDQALDDMREQLGKAMESYCEKMKAPASVAADAPMSDEFLECERDAIRAEYKGQVIDPLLALFREKTDVALKR